MLHKVLLKSLFWPPVGIKLLNLAADVPDVVGNRIVPMTFAFMVIDDQAKGDDQFKVAVIVGGDCVVVPFEPANGFFLPPGNLRIVFIN